MDEQFIKRAFTPLGKELIERLEKAGVDAARDRWSEGIEHHPESEKLVRELSEIDFIFFDHFFAWKIGGDGDDGEALMYMLDVLFELRDKEAEQNK